MSIALATTEPNAIERHEPRAAELSVEEIVARVQKVHEVQRSVMQDGHHYGKIPGVDKPTLLKPGAEILGLVFRLDPQFEVVEQIRDGQHLTVVIKCTLYHIPTGNRMGSGMGSCSTHESKYAYRKGERQCPKCGANTIIKGKTEYGGGWLCFAKKGGCGAKFSDNDSAITSQQTGRVQNEDLADQHNTVLKMAIKRAHVAAILFVTCASDIFTQDVEDMGIGGESDETAAKRPQQQRKQPPAEPTVRFGKNKGTPVSKLTDRQLVWYIDTAEKNLSDQSKSQHHTSEREWLTVLMTEQRRREDPERAAIESEPLEAEYVDE